MLPEPQKTEITNYLLAAATAWQKAHPTKWFAARDLLRSKYISWENSPLVLLNENPTSNKSPEQMLGILLQEKLTANGFEKRQFLRDGRQIWHYRRLTWFARFRALFSTRDKHGNIKWGKWGFIVGVIGLIATIISMMNNPGESVESGRFPIGFFGFLLGIITCAVTGLCVPVP